MGRTFALLVGIDAYPAPVPGLTGCVNDVRAVERLLRRIGDPAPEVVTLVDHDATRGAVVRAFREHLGQAGPDDAVLFWYSGHGSQRLTTRTAGTPPDGKDQTLVLVDSRRAGAGERPAGDLPDVQLGALITEVAAAGPHVAVVLDSCHSGSGTRDALDPVVGVRRALPETGVAVVAPSAPGDHPAGWSLGVGRHVLLAAARPDQAAKEIDVDGVRRGAFSWALERALTDSDGRLAYASLVESARQRVQAQVSDQTPQLEATDDHEVAASFLGGAGVADRPARYAVRRSASAWFIDVGLWHGLPSGRLLPGAQPVVDLYDDPMSAEPVTQGLVVEVTEQDSRVELPDDLPDGAYWAQLRSLPEPPLGVSLPPSAPVELVELVAASPWLRPAPAPGAQADVRVSDRGLEVVDGRAVDLRSFLVQAPADAVRVLERLARWYETAALTGPLLDFEGGRVRVELEVEHPALPRRVFREGTVDLPYMDGRPQRFRLRIDNRSSRAISATVLHLEPNVAISTDLVPSNVVRIASSATSQTHEWQSNDGVLVGAVVPDALWARGVSARVDVLKVLLSVGDIDPHRFTQSGIEAAPEASLEEGGGVREFDVGGNDRVSTAVVTYVLTARRPQPFTELTTDTAVLGGTGGTGGVAVHPHPGLRAQVRIATYVSDDRDAMALLTPPGLLDDPAASVPFSFTSARGVEAMDVLELTDVSGADTVTRDAPLRLQLLTPLADDEQVLLVGRVGDTYVPLGRSRGRESIEVEQLPDAVSTKSLTGAVRLLARKFVRRWLGGKTETVRLALPSVEAGDVRYDADPQHVRTAVSAATDVLVLVHGIIGDTRGMALACLLPGPDARSLRDRFDVVLTVDYENLHTTVDETAAQLHAKLTQAGVTSQQRVVVVAHSMGGLVLRWLIEKSELPPLVDELVTLGTPNGGSPWPSVQDGVWSLLTFGLNKIGAAAWPAWAFSGLLSGVEALDRAFDDMQPNSERLQALAAAPDPHVPYHVLIGNTDLIDGYDAPRAVGALRALGRRVADLAFLRQPNDLAVAVMSAEHLPDGRVPAPVRIPVASDHVTYFSTPAALEQLEALLLDRDP